MKSLSFITYKAVGKSRGIAQKVALITVSFAVAAIIVAMSVASGFRNELTGLILEREGDLWLEYRDSSLIRPEVQPVDSELICQLFNCKAKNVEPRISAPVVILGDGYSSAVEIRSSSEIHSDGVVLSSILAEKLSIACGDTLDVIYSLKFPFSFPVVVDSLMECGIKELSESIGYASFSTVTKFKGSQKGYVDGYVVCGGDIDLISELIYPRQIWMYDSQDRFSGIFDWLDVIDGNVWLVVVIMIIVATINMLAASLSIILENTKVIAILTSIGMPKSRIRAGILMSNLRISFAGALIGFVFAMLFCYLQYYFRLIPLPSSDYIVNFVPVKINMVSDIVAAILSVLIISMLTLFVTLVINSIKEDKILRYE